MNALARKRHGNCLAKPLTCPRPDALAFAEDGCVMSPSGFRQGHAGRPGAPHAETARLEAELARPVRGLVLDLVDADGIFEDHPVRPFEVQEPRPGGWMPAGAEHDRHALARQMIEGPQHVIIALNLVVDVM